MIAFDRVRIRYPGSADDAIHDVSLSAGHGAVTAVVGPNGSGKSTLVRALLRRTALAGGQIRIDDIDALTLAPRELAMRVAVVTQREEPAFPLAVREYVGLGRHAHQSPWSPPSSADREAVERALRSAGVDSIAARRTDALSGGEWQRVRLARAIAQATPILVLDEPTTFLDIAHEMACFELLAALASEGRAVLVVSHQLNLVARFADRVILLNRGHVTADGSPAEVMRGEILERVYEWPLVVSRDPAVGTPTLVPLRRRPASLPASPIRVDRVPKDPDSA